MPSIRLFLRKHCLAVGLGASLLLVLDGAFIWYQKEMQAELIASISEPGAWLGDVIITTEPKELGIFSRRDRVRVTVASSLLSIDPTRAPISFDFDVVASFGPFGLTGDIFPLNRTPSTAKLLNHLQGTHPRLSIRYMWRAFSRELNLRAEASPFDMRFFGEEPGIGPVSWRFVAKKGVLLKLQLPNLSNVHSLFEIPEFTAEFADPARNTMIFGIEGAKFANRLELNAETPVETDWVVRTSEGTAKAALFAAGDWRGMLRLVFRDIEANSSQKPNASSDALDGTYAFKAKAATFAVDSPHVQKRGNTIEAREFDLTIDAQNVPIALMRPADDVGLAAILSSAGLMHFNVERLQFDSGKARCFVTGHLTTGLEGGVVPTLNSSMHAEVPENVLQFLETIVRGSRKSLADFRLAPFMVRHEDQEKGTFYTFDFKGSLDTGVEINNQPAS